jgi:hypothetical protein
MGAGIEGFDPVVPVGDTKKKTSMTRLRQAKFNLACS